METRDISTQGRLAAPRQLRGWAKLENFVLLGTAILLAIFHYGGLVKIALSLFSPS